MSIKLRVYEVARDLGLDNKALVALLQSVGVPDVRNHMSAVPPEVVERVKRHIEKQKQQTVVEERIRPTVVKRRAAPRSPEASAPSHPAPVATHAVDWDLSSRAQLFGHLQARFEVAQSEIHLFRCVE